MNTDHGIPQNPEKKDISVVVFRIISAVSAVFALILPDLGFIAMIAMSACVIFLSSARAPFILSLIPILGLVGVYFRGDVSFLFIGAALYVSSFISGRILLSGGNFHRGLMTFTLVFGATVAAGGTVYCMINGITPADISDYMKTVVHEMMSEAVNSMGQTLPLETAKLLTEQYETVAYTAVIYIPAVAGCGIGLVGILSLRLAGFIHDLTGCDTYPKERRTAVVDRIFAVIYLAALVLGALDVSIVGVCASNVMITLMVPASAAGVAAYRSMIGHRRRIGKRGIPFSLIMLIVSFVFFSPVVGLMILAFTGVFAAFAKKSGFRDPK